MIAKIKNKLKSFFSKRENKILVVAILIILIIVLVVAIVFKKDEDSKFALNGIYDVYPEDVRELYSNMVSVSCYGDLHLDITLGSGIVKVGNINKNNLLDYMFSNLDKNNKLTDQMDIDIFKNVSKNLFSGNVTLDNLINGYTYGEYKYIVKDDKVSREKKECISDKNYITHLYGYSYNVNELSIDVNIGYLDNGVLYDLSDNRLGEYTGEVKELQNLFKTNSFYRYNYVKDDGKYKLISVEWANRI